MVHGGIDGSSRFLVFLRVSEVNTKQIVADYFVEAIRAYGVPSRIRVDHGGENNTVCSIMEELRGIERGSAIRGRSVHNQRIERSWLDLWNGVTNLYHDVFSFLEREDLLDVDNEKDIWLLHFVYKPRIARDITAFLQQWNNHPLRTEQHRSPLQLFVERSLSQNIRNIMQVDDIRDAQAHQMLHQHWDSATTDAVEVPEIECPFTDEQVQAITDHCDPLDDSSDLLGLALYRAVRAFTSSF